MFRSLLVFLLILPGFCPTFGQTDITHTLFLVGDGGEPYVKDSPLGKVLREKIAAAAGNPTVLFLGDNVYPAGLPPADSRKYAAAELALQTQVGFVQGLDAKGVFIPGNHDWQHWGRKGLDYLANQQHWLDSLNDPRITLLPRDGCPGPVEIPLDDNNLLIILDTQWFLHQWEKPEDPSACGVATAADVMVRLEEILRANAGKRVLIAGHHPLITYGEHGGVFTWKAHIFPLEELTDYLYVPLPVIGSIYPLYRRWLGHIQDTAHPVYRQLAGGLRDLMREYPGTFYLAGHEHALQYIVRDSTHFIVSGSAAKTEFVKKKKYAVFASDVRGFTQIALHSDGKLSFRFFQADDRHPDGLEVFSREVPAVARHRSEAQAGVPVRSGEHVRVRASSQYVASRLRRRMLGSNYREAWSQEVDVPVFDLAREKGGLKILQKGGGQQTLSLRLADSAGHEYVLRSVEKFPEGAIPEVLRGTFAQDLVQDQISASHPYAALIVAPLAEAVGLYHTNPRLVFIPDDPRLGQYRQSFANTLALFEERPDEDWSEAPFFGHSGNIISTRKLLEKKADNHDHRVDEAFVLRNRLFDLVIGDWDRHDDQWRWATIKDGKGKLYRPIPRDRDQAFFVNEGMLARIWSRRWALPKFEGFDEDIDWPAGLSFNARHFDRTFLNGLSRSDWIAAAESLRTDLTDTEIEAAVRKWPEEIFSLHGEEVIGRLKARRDRITEEAISYYEFLARQVEITGSGKRERFEITRLPGGDVHVTAFKAGKRKEGDEKLYDRLFLRKETDEIIVYGLGGDDIFEVTGPSARSIRVRVVGGDGDDILSGSQAPAGGPRKTFFYDQTGQGELRMDRGVKDLRSSDPAVNEYDRTAFDYDRLAPLVYGHYNFDDGVFLGGGFVHFRQGFRKDPFAQRHLFLASVAPLTRSYNFRYQGKFIGLVGKWDLEVEADIKAPNYVNNFFGMGNESVFDRGIDEVPGLAVDEAIQYYRYRFEEITLYPSLSRSLGRWGTFQAGPLLQRIEMEEPQAGEDRFITEYARTLSEDLFSEYETFAGVAWTWRAGKTDDALFPQRGSAIRLSGRHLEGRRANGFSGMDGEIAFYHSFREESRLVFAARAGGGVNAGHYPFYQAQVLDGRTALRGYRKTRFYGDSRLFFNGEIRLKLLTFRSYLFPASLGVLGFHDVGRIWYKNEEGIDPSAPDGRSEQWHRGWGGGVWFTPFNLTVLSVEAAKSREGALGYVRFGFLF